MVGLSDRAWSKKRVLEYLKDQEEGAWVSMNALKLGAKLKRGALPGALLDLLTGELVEFRRSTWGEFPTLVWRAVDGVSLAAGDGWLTESDELESSIARIRAYLRAHPETPRMAQRELRGQVGLSNELLGAAFRRLAQGTIGGLVLDRKRRAYLAEAPGEERA